MALCCGVARCSGDGGVWIREFIVASGQREEPASLELLDGVVVLISSAFIRCVIEKIFLN